MAKVNSDHLKFNNAILKPSMKSRTRMNKIVL